VLNKQICDIFNLGHAVLATYARYDPNRNPPMAFRDDPNYRVELFDLRRHTSSTGRVSHDEAYLEQYDMDRRSVYVGGIKQSLTEHDVRSLMEKIGPVLRVQFVKRAPVNGRCWRELD
jgi:hypothetical protein